MTALASVLTCVKTPHVLVFAASLGLSASAQKLPSTTRDGVRVSLSLDKLAYAVGEDIPLHIAAQVVSGERPVYGEPDRPSAAFFTRWNSSNAFHLIITDEDGLIVGNEDASNLIVFVGGSSGPTLCPAPLQVGHVYPLDISANKKERLLPTKPGTYRLTASWSPYTVSDPPCSQSRASDSKVLQSFVTVSSVPITIHVSTIQ